MTKSKNNNQKSNFIVDGTILTLVKSITLIASIVQTMILSRMLTIAEYGDYSQLLIIVSLGTTLCSLGLTNAVNYFYNSVKQQEEKEKYINSIVTITILSGLTCALICFIFRNPISIYFSNPALSGLLIYIIFKPLFDNIVALYQPLYISLHKAKKIAIRNLIISFLKTILVPLSYYLTKNIVWMFITQIILDILQLLYFTIDLKKMGISLKINKPNNKIYKEILKYSIPLALALLLGNLFKESDKLIIARLMNKEALAIYTNMSKQLPFEYIATSFAAVITPVIVSLYKTDKNETAKLWSKYLKLSYIITWILCSGTIICSKELLLFLYSEKYIAGLSIFVIYLFAEFLRFTYFGLIPSSCGKTKIILISSLCSLVLNIILNIVFYKIIGFSGPAWASLFSVFLIGMLQFIYSCRILDKKITEVIDIKHMISFISKLCIIGVLLFLLKQEVYKIINYNLIILMVIYGLNVIINVVINWKDLKTLAREMK